MKCVRAPVVLVVDEGPAPAASFRPGHFQAHNQLHSLTAAALLVTGEPDLVPVDGLQLLGKGVPVDLRGVRREADEGLAFGIRILGYRGEFPGVNAQGAKT
jgi:hypothetical protein